MFTVGDLKGEPGGVKSGAWTCYPNHRATLLPQEQGPPWAPAGLLPLPQQGLAMGGVFSLSGNAS